MSAAYHNDGPRESKRGCDTKNRHERHGDRNRLMCAGSVAEMIAVAVIPTILCPLPDVAVHLVEAPGFWLESVNRNCAMAIFSP